MPAGKIAVRRIGSALSPMQGAGPRILPMMFRRFVPLNFVRCRRAIQTAAQCDVKPQSSNQITDPLFRKLLYRCNHRGMLENELILTSYLQKHYTDLSEMDVVLFERLLDEPDPSIYRWFTGAAEADMEYRGSQLLKSIQTHLKSNVNQQ